MNTPRFFRLAPLLAALVLALGLSNRVQAQSTDSAPLLRDAFVVLAHAAHDYNGHRVAAMRQIRLAIAELTGKAADRAVAADRVQRSVVFRGQGGESQALSDARLRNALSLLQQAGGESSGLVLQHVNTAIAQLDVALAIR
jgi:hypothetical protein